VPVTVKIRKGWDDNQINAVEVAKICEASGAAAITIHGRTRQQYYKPPVDYEIIREVKNSVTIPVIANGDIYSAQKAKQVMDFTGCDLVMLGRATLGNPWLFSQINSYLENPEQPLYFPTLEERLDIMVEHIEKMVEYKGEHMAMLQARKLVAGYFKGMRGAASLRQDAGKISTINDLYALRHKALNI
jgi:nifR3 family TIM-barrel protein